MNCALNERLACSQSPNPLSGNQEVRKVSARERHEGLGVCKCSPARICRVLHPPFGVELGNGTLWMEGRLGSGRKLHLHNLNDEQNVVSRFIQSNLARCLVDSCAQTQGAGYRTGLLKCKWSWGLGLAAEVK